MNKPESVTSSSSNPTTCLCLPGSSPTSTGRRTASFRPEIEIDGIKTRVLVEQITVVDPQARLGEFAGRLGGAEIQAVNAALQSVLALD